MVILIRGHRAVPALKILKQINWDPNSQSARRQKSNVRYKEYWNITHNSTSNRTSRGAGEKVRILSFWTFTKHQYFKSRNLTILKANAYKSNKNVPRRKHTAGAQWEPNSLVMITPVDWNYGCGCGWVDGGFYYRNSKLGYLPKQFSLLAKISPAVMFNFSK